MPSTFSSLRTRLTGAVMVPLLALVAMFGVITCWVVNNSMATTSDRILIGSVRVLSRAYDAEAKLRPTLFPLAVHLLQRRSAPVTYYSVYHGRALLAGVAGLGPPADYRFDNPAANDRHPAATFPRTFRNTPLVRGYVDPGDAIAVLQPAYLRYGSLFGKPVRIATEIRLLKGDPHPVVIQVADFLDDRRMYEQSRFLQVISAGILIAMLAVLLFYWAITWGLKPFSALTDQVEAARNEPPLHFRLTLEDKAPREAHLLARAFNGLIGRTERATTSLRQFTANASHQMRTPLAIVRVHLDILQRFGAASPQGQAALTDIGDAVTSLERLLLQLISLARTDEQPIDLDSCFDLAEVTTDVIGDRFAQICDAGIDISCERASEIPLPARGHARLAAEMISNLIDNAVRYNRPGGAVVVRLGRDDDHARIEIEDDGPGIPAAVRDRVWERFYRLTPDDGRGGSGLGLPIVRALADRMGAVVTLADGRDGRGLRAVIEFIADPADDWEPYPAAGMAMRAGATAS
jgi:two-component system sensor histidine kinase TctE